jgi:hypothetical protein
VIGIPALARNLLDGVDAVAQHAPEIPLVAHATGIATGQADDRDRLLPLRGRALRSHLFVPQRNQARDVIRDGLDGLVLVNQRGWQLDLQP